MPPRLENPGSIDARAALSAALAALTLALVLSGCGSVQTTTRTHRATLADNDQEFNRYVERRTEALYRMGATKDRSAAEFQARTEATRRYGERIPESSASWSWGSSKKEPALTLADYEKMTRDAAKAR